MDNTTFIENGGCENIVGGRKVKKRRRGERLLNGKTKINQTKSVTISLEVFLFFLFCFFYLTLHPK
jgi:hypothetical protein